MSSLISRNSSAPIGVNTKVARKKAARTFGRKRQQLTTDNIVVEKWGHMRNLQGRAYVPGLVPAGVSIDEIK